MYMTACNLQKSFSFDRKYRPYMLSSSYRHIIVNRCYISRGIGVIKVSYSTFTGADAIWQATYDFLLVFSCNYISILYHFRDIITYSPKFYEVTWLWTHTILKKKCMKFNRQWLVLVISVTYCGPYIMASVPRYPLVKPKRAWATTVTASLCINDGSCRSGTTMFDNKNTGTKASRNRESVTSSMRLDFRGYIQTDRQTHTHTLPQTLS